MKMKILKFIALMLAWAGSFSSCKESSDITTVSDFTTVSDITGVWVCNPESNVTITLTFDSGTVYVNTSPKNLFNGYISKQYLFNDGDKYIVHGDTLFYVNPNLNDPADYGFIGKMISSNKIALQSYKRFFIDEMYVYVTDYSFKRKNK